VTSNAIRENIIVDIDGVIHRYLPYTIYSVHKRDLSLILSHSHWMGVSRPGHGKSKQADWVVGVLLSSVQLMVGTWEAPIQQRLSLTVTDPGRLDLKAHRANHSVLSDTCILLHHAFPQRLPAKEFAASEAN
jgi:hypothetical protein